MPSDTSTTFPFKPLGVRPKGACQMMSIGKTKLYEIIEAGEVDTYLDDGVRIITVESIERRHAQKLAEATAKKQMPRPENTKSKRKPKSAS